MRARNFLAMAKGDEDREKRLAEALRQNLRRRKAQARGTDAADQDGKESPGSD